MALLRPSVAVGAIILTNCAIHGIFALLISIPSPRLTDTCVSHRLALRVCGEWANYLGRLGLSSFPLTLILYHILSGLSRGIRKFFEKIPKFHSGRTYCLIVSDAFDILRILDLLLSLLTLILYHIFGKLSIDKMHKVLRIFFFYLYKLHKFGAQGSLTAPEPPANKKRACALLLIFTFAYGTHRPKQEVAK